MRAGRRTGTLAIGRVALGGLLLGAMWALYTASMPAEATIRGSGTDIGKRLNQFAESFALTFFFVQATAVLLLTPVFVAGAIFEERETRSGEILLTTELTRREVYVGKLGARMVQVLLVILAGMPILFLTQLWGGVSLTVICVNYAATGIAVIGAGVVTAAVSAYAESLRAAILRSYFLLFLIDGVFVLASPYFVIGLSAVHWIAGAIVLGVIYIPLQIVIVWVGYSIGQRWLRMAMLRQKTRLDESSNRSPPPPLPGRKPIVRTRRIPDDVDPLLWKELNAGGRITLRDVRAAFTTLPGSSTYEDRVEEMGSARWFVASREPTAFALRTGAFFFVLFFAGLTIANVISPEGLVRYVGGLALCWMMCAVGLTAAGGVARERQKQTLIDLLMLPGPRRDLLWAKLIGALTRGIGPGLALFGIVLVGALGAGVSILAIPLLIGSAIAFAIFAAGLGIWLSARCKNLVTANGAWIGIAAAATIGTFLLAHANAGFVAEPGRPPQFDYPTWGRVVNPLLAWGRLCFWYDYRNQQYAVGESGSDWELTVEDVAPALGCPVLYGLVGFILWFAAVRRFEKEGRS